MLQFNRIYIYIHKYIYLYIYHSYIISYQVTNGPFGFIHRSHLCSRPRNWNIKYHTVQSDAKAAEQLFQLYIPSGPIACPGNHFTLLRKRHTLWKISLLTNARPARISGTNGS